MAMDTSRTVVLDGDTYEWFVEAISQMQAIYADEERTDCFGADDIARDVAEMLGDFLGVGCPGDHEGGGRETE